MVPDHLTSEWAGTHNFRGIAKIHKCFGKLGTSASIWAVCKASIFKIVRLAATWKFFRYGHEKMLKTGVFHKTLISRNLLKEAHIQARSMWKLTSRAFQKCGTYWAYHVLNGSYCWSKSDGFEILAPLAKIRGVPKKDTATILSFERCHWISVEPTMLGHRWFNFRPQNSKLWPCLFFGTPPSQQNFPLNLTRLWQPIAMV